MEKLNEKLNKLVKKIENLQLNTTKVTDMMIFSYLTKDLTSKDYDDLVKYRLSKNGRISK